MVYIWFVCKYESTQISYIHIKTILYNMIFKPTAKPYHLKIIQIGHFKKMVPCQRHRPIHQPKTPIQSPWWSQHWVSWHPLPPPSLDPSMVSWWAGRLGAGPGGGGWVDVVPLGGGKLIGGTSWALGPMIGWGWWVDFISTHLKKYDANVFFLDHFTKYVGVKITKCLSCQHLDLQSNLPKNLMRKA